MAEAISGHQAQANSSALEFAQRTWAVRRPKPFVLVFEGGPQSGDGAADYLHELLLTPAWREDFYRLVDATGLVVCLNLPTQHPSYRDVRGRSSKGRLSQGEYFHHDGCSGPQKPRIVEIRCPYQNVSRSVATAVAPHRAVVTAMLSALPEQLARAEALAGWRERLDTTSDTELDQLQGLINRSVRRNMTAEECRAYFRQVDRLADAYFEPWALGESRLIANANPANARAPTMQHRRAYQDVHSGGVANGHLVKRWPNEELALPGQTVDPALLAAICNDEDGACFSG